MLRSRVVAAALVAAFAFLGEPAAHAAEHAPSGPFHPDDVGEGLVHDLARVFVSEAGWDAPREHAALGWTLARRAQRLRERRGMGAQQVIRAIADRTLVEPRTDRQRWLYALRLDGARPVEWERWTTARWGRRTDGWKAALTAARALVRGELADPCDGPSELWGSPTHPVDRAALERNIRAGVWVRVDCGLEHRSNVFVRWGSRAERTRAARERPPPLGVRFVD